MTNEEAINLLDNLVGMVEDNQNSDYDTALKMAIEALKQPERKKGMFIGTEFDGYADGNPVYYEWICSECGCTFEDNEPTYNFCPNCGADMRADFSQHMNPPED